MRSWMPSHVKYMIVNRVINGAVAGHEPFAFSYTLDQVEAGALGAKEVADMLGIGESTVRTHLQRMFSKTSTSRQVELLQLLQTSTPPIKPV